MEFASNDVNQAKVDLYSDRGNSLIVCSSLADISPYCARYQLICSTIDMLLLPENLVKSGILYCGGSGSLSNYSRYGR
jgi:hypothetical protein